ncbi:hypothetical protein L1987_44953 [Smallanthus sonchifolius]|uniref:Uncharacterized protein n=1 Tax=Smallanthus sonchifolius TaxID=185202 RepID=A0ACB9GQW5_9ASTR|nr:hypothetical protein L1987_44953 [Smallanthus sonchifolius]
MGFTPIHNIYKASISLSHFTHSSSFFLWKYNNSKTLFFPVHTLYLGFRRLRCSGGTMEVPEAKSQLNNPIDLHLQSHPSIDSDEELVQVLTQDFQNLVLSCKDEGFDRDLQGYSVVIDDEDQMKQAIYDELRQLVVKEAVNEAFQAESLNGTEEKSHRDVRRFVDEVIGRQEVKKVLEVDPKECRVLEEREIGESEVGCENHEEGVDDDEKVSDDDLNEKHEIEIVDGDVGDEIGGYGHVEDLENERENVGGSVTVADDGRLKSYYYPLRPDAEDCSYYMRTGMCKYGSNCKFNHPLRRRHQPTKEIQKQKEEHMEMHGQIECKYYLSPVGCKYGKSCKFSHVRGKTVITSVVEYNFLGLPIRTGEKECLYYMRNGSCKYGPNCRFNHPDPSAGGDAPTTYGNDGPLPLQPPPQPNIPNMPTWTGPRTPDPTAAFVPVMYPPTQNMPPTNPDWNGYQAPAHVYPSSERGLPIPPAFFLNNPSSDANMYTHHQHPMVVSEYPERPGQPDCSYFMKTGDCKYRASCKFHHPKSCITRTTPSVLSDKGLPLRPDQNICTYYSWYGICKYGPACKYDHPVNYNINLMPTGEGYDGSDRPGPLIQQSV